MKKLLLLLAGSFSIIGANAQNAARNTSALSNTTRKVQTTNVQDIKSTGHHASAKTTVVTIATEDFHSGTHTSLPTGWTAGTLSGSTGTWHWTQVASTSAYSMGAMHSTTASNGWMIFDSDSIGTACSCIPAGWLQSPSYNCSGHTTVRLNFEDFYRSFYDSCFVWVSTSPTFATYTQYPVLANNSLATNSSTANTASVHINISTAAAGQPVVYIRFVYLGDNGGSYSWMIDDMSLTEINPHDVGIASSFMYEPEATAYNGSIFNTPLAFIDSVYPVTQLTNYGANAETNVSTTANIYRSGSSVYTHSITYPSLPLNAYDSIVQFQGFLPNVKGNYTCAFNTTLTGDADLTNNIDTVLFNVTDTLWQENLGLISGSLYCHKASSGASYLEGTRFDVPTTSAGDTVSGFGVAFSSSSVPTNSGGLVSVQLYSIQQASTGWTYVGTSVARAITSSDISTTSGIVWADFRIDQIISGGVTPFILHAGTTYAAMVQVKGVTTDLLVDATVAPDGTGFASGYFGQSDTSLNDGGTSFSPTAITTGNPSDVPLVRMYFGNVPNRTAVNNVTLENNIGAAYPDPANTTVTVPFTMAENAVVTITLTNIIGQVVATQSVHASGGQFTRATFATSNLANGVYIFNVAANGQNTTGRVVIAH